MVIGASSIALLAKDLRFGYPRQQRLLEIPELKLETAQSLFLYGPSGCGKSTLLNLLAGTLRPHSGHIELAGQSLEGLSAAGRDRLRGDHMGFLFQQFNLLPFLSVLDNVILPCRFSKRRATQAVARHGSLRSAAEALLSALDLPDASLWHRRAGQLSVGQQQRVAAARALIGEPTIVLADEPTSALDADAQQQFIELLFAECRRTQAALLFVSHDRRLSQHFDLERDLRELNRATPGPDAAPISRDLAEESA